MSFASRCSTEFLFTVRSRGERHFREGRVSLEIITGERAVAVVMGSSGDFEVVLNWRKSEEDDCIEASCTCSFFDKRGLCEHIWATILAADAKGIGPRGGSRSLGVMEVDPGEWDLDEEPGEEGPRDDDSEDLADEDDWVYPLPKSASRGSPRRSASKPKPTPPAPNWRNQLTGIGSGESSQESGRVAIPAAVKSRELRYVLDVSSTLATGSLVIHFFHRQTKKNGEFGKLKPLSTREDSVDRLAPPEDREIVRILLASNAKRDESYGSYGRSYGSYGYGYQPGVSQVAMAATAHEYLLPKLCATGRFVWVHNLFQPSLEEQGRPLAWDAGPPWRFQLRADPDDQRSRWVLQGELVREGEEAATALSTPVVLLASGLVVFEDRLGRLEAGGVFPWIAAFRKNPVIEVPYRDRWELLQRLACSPSRPDASLPANLRCEEVRLPPQGRLTVHSPESYRPDRLQADIQFQYGDKRIAAKDRHTAVLDPDNQRIVVRDREQEKRLLALLAEQGARVNDYGEHDVWIPHARFPALVATLVEAGWIVEAEGRKIRKPGEWRLSVTSGIDWFDLEGTCDFDGQEVRLPDLLEALRRGEGFVRLGDGSQGLLPQEWLKRFGGLVEMGEAEDDRIRFRPSQALLLDALLAAHKEVSVDQQFDHLRKKLRSFEGVSPRDEPRGFQGELRNYQKEGLGWLDFLRDFHLGGCLADDMGLGKTVQVLAQLQARRLRPTNGDGGRTPSLAVVPRSLVFNWIDEAKRFTPNLRVLDYTGALRAGALEQIGEYDLVITTYGTLCRDIAQLKDVHFDYAILDEAQAIKNAGSQRAKACRLLKADHRLATTGTPVENHLGELWSLFEFLNPGMLGRSSVFKNLSKNMTSENGDLALLRRALQPFILRRTKGQVLRDLPEKTEQTLYCDLPPNQRKHYNQLRDFYRASLSDRIQKSGMAKAKIHVLEALLRLRQAACHPGLLDKDRVNESSVKLDTLVEQLAEVLDEGHKALVFSQFTSLLAIVRRRLDAEKIVYEYLDGQTRDRKARVERFQNDPACPLFLISLKAGGHGLNLTAADYVFLLDPWWNPAVEAQAVDRTHRIGQTRRVFAYRLIARDTVEEKVIELQKTKRDLAEAIISADGNILGQLTAEDLQMLLS